MFEVAQFDNYSYLFNSPYLVNLEGRSLPQALTISGMAIGINGKEAVTGQSWLKQRFNLASGTALSEGAELSAQGVDVILDDRGERPGAMFADWELIGVPHRVTIGDRGLKAGQLEYQHRRDAAATQVAVADVVALLRDKLQA